jgi:hypothetical protein
MLISPPFLPAPIDGESDDAYVNRAMQGGVPGDGGFPLSFDLNWHGGIHLTAPQEGTARLPVRAIADGTLVYVRQPTDETSAPADHGLRYRDNWTDNGCIVLKHETEIGEGVGASVVFYSIYMHLSQITLTTSTKGAKVYRKDELGKAGRIYGQNHRIHFEIIADQSEIAKLVGRSERLLDHHSGNGRTDSCWGDMYFFIPPEVLAYEAAPTNRLQSENGAPVVYRCPALPSGAPPVVDGGSAEGKTDPAPLVQGYEWAIASQLQEGIFVRMRYERGQCTLTSFLISGEEIGSHQEEADYEYNLYRTATTLYPQRPSAGYELLRFGRVLGPDTLQPAEAAHWRQIALPPRSGGPETGWVNLNATTVAKFSDADFPHWQGWQLIDDDTDFDSHCQSPFIRSLLRLDDDKVVSDQVDAVSIALSPAYAGMSEEEKLKLSERYERERVQNEAALRDEVVQKQLKRLICKFPSEWVKNDFDTRYGWLRMVAPGGPLTEESYDRLKKHHEELAFWEDAALEGIQAKHWHLPGKELILKLRMCGWLSSNELAQCIPRNVIEQTRSQGQTVYPRSSISWSTALSRANRFKNPLNKALRKFLISSSKLRMSYFLANSIQETTYLSRTAEGGGPTLSYAPWYGRGMMQLTWEENYQRYTNFKTGSIRPTFQEALETDLSHAAESAGFYWVSTARPIKNALSLSRYADITPALEMQVLRNVCSNYSYRERQCSVELSSIEYYVSPQLELVARGVNTGNPEGTGIVNGLTPRRVVFSSCLVTLTETTFPEGGSTTVFPLIIDRQLP